MRYVYVILNMCDLNSDVNDLFDIVVCPYTL